MLLAADASDVCCLVDGGDVAVDVVTLADVIGGGADALLVAGRDGLTMDVPHSTPSAFCETEATSSMAPDLVAGTPSEAHERFAFGAGISLSRVSFSICSRRMMASFSNASLKRVCSKWKEAVG
jgi:hypothetical protein